MINNLTLVGRSCADPEVKHFESGNVVTKLRIAVDRSTKEKETDFFEVEIWGKQAEVAARYIKKGHLFGIVGRLKQETWEERGNKRSKVFVVANDLRLMQPRDSDSDDRDSDGDDVFNSFR